MPVKAIVYKESYIQEVCLYLADIYFLEKKGKLLKLQADPVICDLFLKGEKTCVNTWQSEVTKGYIFKTLGGNCQGEFVKIDLTG